MLKLIDINDFIDDDQKVKLVAYGITIYEGDALHIPAGYAKYPLGYQELGSNKWHKIHTEGNTLIISMDC